jgi:hypothetical protein
MTLDGQQWLVRVCWVASRLQEGAKAQEVSESVWASRARKECGKSASPCLAPSPLVLCSDFGSHYRKLTKDTIYGVSKFTSNSSTWARLMLISSPQPRETFGTLPYKIASLKPAAISNKREHC